MKKHGTKLTRPVHPGSEVGHLDETLTEITTTTAHRLKKWRTPLITLVVAVIVVQVGLFAMRGIKESKQVRLNQQVFDLVQSPESRRTGYVLDQARLEKLLGEVRDDPLEGYVYEAVVQFYLERAAALKDEATGRGSLAAEPPNVADPAKEKGVLEAFDRAAALAQEAASRLPGDKDIQAWAALVKTKVSEEKEAPWLKAKRKYALPVPGTADPAPGVPDPAPVVPDPTPDGKAETLGVPDPAPVVPDPAPAPSAPAGGQAPAPSDTKAPEKGSG